MLNFQSKHDMFWIHLGVNMGDVSPFLPSTLFPLFPRWLRNPAPVENGGKHPTTHRIHGCYIWYLVTFTINIPPMLAYIPYMDPMGYRAGFQPSVWWCRTSSIPRCNLDNPEKLGKHGTTKKENV